MTARLPIITMNPIPGQEDRNLSFLVNQGAAIMVDNNYSVLDAMNMIFNCPWRLDMIRESVRKLGKPNAAEELYNFSAAKLWKKLASI